MKSNKPSHPAEGGIHQPKSPNSKAEQTPYRGDWLLYRDRRKPNEWEPTELVLSAEFSLHDNAEVVEPTTGNPWLRRPDRAEVEVIETKSIFWHCWK